MKSVDLSTDVLAVRCVGDHVFIGMGCTLYLLRKSDHELEAKIDVLHPDNIHGIVFKSNNRLIVFGGRSLCIFELNFVNNSLQLKKLHDVHRLPDWIISIECLKETDDTILSILFAHNNVFTYNTSTKKYINSSCQEKCLLYGGTISGSTSDNAVIFSGTVFQEILIWKVKNMTDRSSPVLHRLKGHNGVIFSVFYSPVKNLICSTSDDRTVRLWKISETSSEKNEVEWEKVHISLQTTMFGHVARVWKSMIVNDMVISIGEDSKMCTWTLEGKLLNKIEAHQGAPIWCLDVTEDNKVLTGGSDGAVNSWPLQCDSSNVRSQTLLFANNGCAVPKSVYHLSKDIILVLREDGTLVWFNESGEKFEGNQSLTNSSSSYCILQISPDKTNFVTASIKGEISLYKQNNESDIRYLYWEYQGTWKPLNSKIFSMQWLSNDSLLICGGEGVLLVCKFEEGSFNILSKHTLPMSRERWVATAVSFDNILVCGDRMGNIFVFKITNDMDNTEPVQTFNKIHGRLGVQSFMIIDSKLLTTGRDGTLRFFKIRKSDDGNTRIEYMHKKYMPMDWVSKVLKCDDEYFILGFKEVDFVVYSLTLQRFLVQTKCGGARRSWDCIIDNNVIKFVYIREKEVHSVTVSLQSLLSPLLLPGLQSKEIYCIKRLPNNCENLILFGGEDCSLRIGSIAAKLHETNVHKNLDSFDGHISNLKTIAVMNVESTSSISKNIIFTAGGRAQLKVWEIEVNINKEITKDDIFCKDVLTYMLRGPDMHRKKTKIGDELMYDMDPETRYMDLSILKSPTKPSSIIVFVACSDGYLRVMEYKMNSPEIRLITALPYRNRCILKVHSFEYDGNIIVITMATDGVVRFWNFKCIDNEIVLHNIHTDVNDDWKIHQSGINSFDMQVLTDSFLLATGGDDNLLSLISFKITPTQNGEPKVVIVSHWKTAAVHHAQITGVKLTDNNKLISVGADQILAVHQYLFESKLDVELLSTNILSIPDVQGITLLQSNDVTKELLCIYGKGFQIIQNDC